MTEADLEVIESIWGWEPHSPEQREYLLDNSPVKICAAGRRAGKTYATAVDVVFYSLKNRNSEQIVVAPTNDNTTSIIEYMQLLIRAVPGLIEGRDYTIKQTPIWTLTFNDGEPLKLKAPTRIRAKTLGPTGLGMRGKGVSRVIVDEAAYVEDAIMQRAVGPLLAVKKDGYSGQLVLISSPSGRNHFYEAFLLGQNPKENPRYKSFQFPSTVNPHLDTEFLENERKVLPERIFKIEYLAEFADAEGMVFQNVREACKDNREEWMGPEPGHAYAIGLDLARIDDFTVVTVVDAHPRPDGKRHVVFQDRFNTISWPQQIDKIEKICIKYNHATILAEVNSVGDVVKDLLRERDLPVVDFKTSGVSKQPLIDQLVVAFEQGDIALPQEKLCKVMVNELLAYAYERLPSGGYRTKSPAGVHDDTVVSLALAWEMACRPLAFCSVIQHQAKPMLEQAPSQPWLQGGTHSYEKDTGLIIPPVTKRWRERILG